MPVTKCPGCNCEQTVDAALVSLKVRCKGCGAAFDAKPYRPPEPPTPWLVKPAQMLVAVLLTGGLVAVAGGLAAVVIHFRGEGDAPSVADDGASLRPRAVAARPEPPPARRQVTPPPAQRPAPDYCSQLRSVSTPSTVTLA